MRRVLAFLVLAALTACAAKPALSSAVEAGAVPAASVPTWPPQAAARVRAILGETMRGGFLSTAGIAVVDEGGRLLYGRNASHPYAPASTMKTIVGAAALSTLGRAGRLETSLESLDMPDAEGRIDDLWLVGGGDPMLDPEELRGGIGELAKRGVRRINGDVIVDAGSFRTPEQNPAWAADDFEYGYAAGTSRISLNWNVIEFRVTPAQIGSPARIRVFPADPSIVIRGGAVTGYGTTLRIDRVTPGHNVFRIGGSIAAGAEQSYYRPVDGIPRWAGEVTRQMLREQGIELSGDVRLGPDPLAAQTLWQHRSPPLAEMVKQMFFQSDNHIAEQLLRVLGADSETALGESNATELAGARAERAFLANLHVDVPGLRIVDGSGLAEKNRVAPQTFARLLAAVARSPIGPVYIAALPRAGIEGTVRYHQLTTALGRVHAKSGHIGGVNSLVGYVQTRTHGRLAFAFIANGPDADDSVTVGEGIDRALDAFAAL